jgi:sirohydrochlorin ferrochelatase
MDAVILFAHGSLLGGAGEALEAHAARLRAHGIAPLVEIGYLNYSDPPFMEAVHKCVEAGAKRILVAPYFLAPGKFVQVDLPRAVYEAQINYPDAQFVVAEAIGYDPALADVVIASAVGAPGSDRAVPEAVVEALLVLVHGSPRPTANADMFGVVEVVRDWGIFPIVEVGFLECNAPTIPEAIDSCVAQGATRILAVPYFLHTGAHVAEDLPALLAAGRERHPQVEFRLGDYLGRSERLTDILAARIAAASSLWIGSHHP